VLLGRGAEEGGMLVEFLDVFVLLTGGAVRGGEVEMGDDARGGDDLPTAKLVGRGADAVRACGGLIGESRNDGSLYQFGCADICVRLLVCITASMSADSSATILLSCPASSSNIRGGEVDAGSVF
jgi:hypothetical protein